MIRRVLISILMSALPLLPVSAFAAACNLLADGSFEAGTPNPYWTEASTNFGTPLCDQVSCGTLGSPRTGNWWAWFGGKANADETGSLTQSVLIPADSLPRLNFYLWNPNTSDTGASTDFLTVTIDGGQVFKTMAANPTYTGGYTLVDLDIAPYADGGCHTLSIQGSTFASALPTDIFVDDVAIPYCSPTARTDGTTYPSLQAAMNAAGAGSVITATAQLFTENLLFSQTGSVTFRGGYDCAFSQNPGYTTVSGNLTLSGTGALTMDKVIIR